jgi:hypothetical protein
MSYDPSHYQPPAQGRWPNATPAEAWPSYRDDDVYRDGERLDGQYGANGQGAYQPAASYQRQIGYQRAAGESGDHGSSSAVVTAAFPPARSGYAAADEYGAADGYAWDTRDGFGGTGDGYGTPNGYADATGNGYEYGAGAWNGYGAGSGYVAATRNGYAPGGYAAGDDSFDGSGYGYGSSQDDYTDTVHGYADTVHGYTDTVHGYADTVNGYADQGGYTEPGAGGAVLAAPDADLDPDRWQAEQDRRRAAGQRGVAVGAVTGLLAVAVAIGVSTLVAAFVRPQAAPAIAIGDVFIDRVPAGLRNAAMVHGSHGRTALLLIMYLAIGCVALGMGVLSRRAVALGAASLAAFTMVSAFITITRMGGRAADVIPAIVGGLAGAAALLWLKRASAPVATYPPPRRAPDRRGNRRRAR